MSKKEYILSKAELLFAEKGFDATSVRDIAREARINIAMISYYFGSKAKLMEALFKLRMSVGYNYVKEIMEDERLSVVQKIEKMINGYVQRVANNTKFYQVILAEQATNKNKGVMRFLNKSKENYADCFGKILAEGYEAGVFKNKVDPVLFITTITGTIMQSILNRPFYAGYYGIKISNEEANEKYFNKINEHLKFITKSILGYDYKK